MIVIGDIMKIEYNKLVRNKIPEIIEATGKSCKIRTLEQTEYTEMLKKKLEEECNEYLESGEPEEIADIVDLKNKIERISATKCMYKHLFLVSVLK